MQEAPRGLCKGECSRHRAERPKDGRRYSNGQVRCQVCEIYMSRDGCLDKDGRPADMSTEGLYCRCCGYKVRSRPRNKVYKEKFFRHTSGGAGAHG